jgi:hypothetical protein
LKQISKPITDFIEEYTLEHPIKGVCFEARLYVFTDKQFIELQSEVHIITIEAKALDIIYILNAELDLKGFPDMFEATQVEMIFKQKKGLMIKGNTPGHGNYILLIQPEGKDCIAPSEALMRSEIGINN